jgi:hypothetical protein
MSRGRGDVPYRAIEMTQVSPRPRGLDGALRIALLLLATSLGACRSATELDVSVSTNVSCAQWQGAALAVGELGEELESKSASATST